MMESRDASAFKKVVEKPIAGMGPMTYRRPSARQHCRRCIRRKVRRRILAQTALVLSWLQAHFDMFDTRCHIKKKPPMRFRLPSIIGLFQIPPDLFERETVETAGDHFVKEVETLFRSVSLAGSFPIQLSGAVTWVNRTKQDFIG